VEAPAGIFGRVLPEPGTYGSAASVDPALRILRRSAGLSYRGLGTVYACPFKFLGASAPLS